jgi:hypothetical protein
LFAGRCPHCLDSYQGVYGRIILCVAFIFILLFAAHAYEPSDINFTDVTSVQVDNDTNKLEKLLSEEDY